VKLNFRALDKQTKKRQETNRDGEQSEQSLCKHAKGTTSKQATTALLVPFFTFLLHLTTILHLPSSPS
jgi:hypothetical protein